MPKRTIKSKLKSFAIGLAFALKATEKDTLKQTDHSINPSAGQESKVTTNTVMSSLLKGEITKEVVEFRYRTYKIFNAAAKWSMRNHKSNYYTIDNEKRDFIVENSSIDEELYNKNVPNNFQEWINDKGFIKKTINIEYNVVPSVVIENKVEYIVIKPTEDENSKILEFYIPKIKAWDNHIHNLNMNYLEKCVNKQSKLNLDIQKLFFVTMDVIGVDNFLLFEYDNFNLIEIVEGKHEFLVGKETCSSSYFVIKYKTNCITNGENTLKKYFDADVEKKYVEQAQLTKNFDIFDVNNTDNNEITSVADREKLLKASMIGFKESMKDIVDNPTNE